MNNKIIVARGISALLVVLSHGREMYFGLYIEFSSLITSAFYLVTGFGHQAVIIFFVISGYLVGGNYIEKRPNYFHYLLKRSVRLHVVLIPLLVLSSGLYFINLEGNIDLLEIGSVKIRDNDRDYAINFFGNLFFLQNALVVPWAYNGPLWSLSNEFWYYVLFPPFYHLFHRKNFLLLLISLFCSFLFLGVDIISYFIIWMLGVVSKVYSKVISTKVPSLVSLILIVTLLPFLRFLDFHIFLEDIILGLSVMIFVASKDWKEIRWGAVKHLSDISFSLYVTHFPILLIWYNFIEVNPVVGFIGFIIISIVVSHFFYVLFENKYLKLFSYCERVLGLQIHR